MGCNYCCCWWNKQGEEERKQSNVLVTVKNKNIKTLFFPCNNKSLNVLERQNMFFQFSTFCEIQSPQCWLHDYGLQLPLTSMTDFVLTEILENNVALKEKKRSESSGHVALAQADTFVCGRTCMQDVHADMDARTCTCSAASIRMKIISLISLHTPCPSPLFAHILETPRTPGEF